VAELQKNAGASGETVKNFLATLAENNRLGLLPGVCGKFGELMSAARGEVEMVVTSAQVRRHSQLGRRKGVIMRENAMLTSGEQALDNKTLSRLEAAVSKSSYVGAGKKLKVKNTVRPTSPYLSYPKVQILTNLLRSTPISSVASSSRLATGQST
jgi:F-type H+-transporting ATPase subunit O